MLAPSLGPWGVLARFCGVIVDPWGVMQQQYRPDMTEIGSLLVSGILVPNYPVITTITAVITVILVFWVRKRQIGGNAVSHLASCIRR